jgi:hypothetical protein
MTFGITVSVGRLGDDATVFGGFAGTRCGAV